MRVRVLAPLLFSSGAAALMLEVAWFRRMAQVAGGTSVAMGAVLAAVIGGMALGSWIFGRFADRLAAPARLYGALELGVAVFALLTPTLIDLSQGLFVAAYGKVFLQFVLATLLLAAPAVLMGGTLPAAAAALARPDGRSIGWLYASNTLGAVCGTVAAGFFLLPAFGLSAAMRWAALFSGAAGGAAMLLPRLPAAAGVEGSAGGEGARRAIALYAVSGFMGLAAEVAFARQLVLVFGSSTYAFSAMLAVFLLGIGSGGAIGTRCKAGHLRRLEWTVAVTGALFSLSALSIYFLPRLYLEGHLLLGDSFGAGLALRFGLAALVLLPGSIGLGIAFPLAAHVAGATGASTGRLYAANTISSVAGSTIAVFLLIPWLGAHATIVVVALVAGLACGLRRAPVLLVTACGLIPPPAVAREHLAAGVFFVPSVFIHDGEVDQSAWDEGVDIPFVEYGREATVSIWRWYGRSGLLIDGKSVATNQILADVHHLSLLGHLPMALHENPQRVLVVGLGIGTTFRAVRMHDPEVLRVVEIEEAVVRAAERLDVRPRDLVIADARDYLKATGETFDVITSDPIHPWVRGGGDLYTREYFESVRARLASGGVACQWLPVYQMGVDDIRDIIRTFTSVFTAQAYYGGGDLILVGGVDRRLPAARKLDLFSLKRIGADDLAKLLVATHSRLSQVKGTVLTDDALKLEFSTPRHVANPRLAEGFAFVRGLWRRPPAPFESILEAQLAWAEGDYEAMLSALKTARERAPGHGFVRTFDGELWLLVAGDDLRGGDLKSARDALDRASAQLPGDGRVEGTRAELLAAEGKRAEALAIFRELFKRAPDSAFLRRKIASLE